MIKDNSVINANVLARAAKEYLYLWRAKKRSGLQHVFSKETASSTDVHRFRMNGISFQKL